MRRTAERPALLVEAGLVLVHAPAAVERLVAKLAGDPPPLLGELGDVRLGDVAHLLDTAEADDEGLRHRNLLAAVRPERGVDLGQPTRRLHAGFIRFMCAKVDDESSGDSIIWDVV